MNTMLFEFKDCFGQNTAKVLLQYKYICTVSFLSVIKKRVDLSKLKAFVDNSLCLSAVLF